MLTLKPLVAALSSLVILAASPPLAAQVSDATRTRSTNQVIQPPPPPPPPRQIEPVRTVQPPPMRTELGQRDQPPPVNTPAPRQQANQEEDASRRIGATPAKVYDRNGRALTGMEQVGPNRVRDTRTGRYYDTVPMGDGQRISH